MSWYEKRKNGQKGKGQPGDQSNALPPRVNSETGKLAFSLKRKEADLARAAATESLKRLKVGKTTPLPSSSSSSAEAAADCPPTESIEPTTSRHIHPSLRIYLLQVPPNVMCAGCFYSLFCAHPSSFIVKVESDILIPLELCDMPPRQLMRSITPRRRQNVKKPLDRLQSIKNGRGVIKVLAYAQSKYTANRGDFASICFVRWVSPRKPLNCYRQVAVLDERPPAPELASVLMDPQDSTIAIAEVCCFTALVTHIDWEMARPTSSVHDGDGREGGSARKCMFFYCDGVSDGRFKQTPALQEVVIVSHPTVEYCLYSFFSAEAWRPSRAAPKSRSSLSAGYFFHFPIWPPLTLLLGTPGLVYLHLDLSTWLNIVLQASSLMSNVTRTERKWQGWGRARRVAWSAIMICRHCLLAGEEPASHSMVFPSSPTYSPPLTVFLRATVAHLTGLGFGRSRCAVRVLEVDAVLNGRWIN
ncbi:hypothetical protein B0H14DRAFT_3139338 [Mycena olivaceomarginata]|nr:hypothetical protein B0H14DRAFT_3139338 [Mycena olivaceomarginata]